MKTSVSNLFKLFLLPITFYCAQCELDDQLTVVPVLPNAVRPGIHNGTYSIILDTKVSTRVEFKENNEPVSIGIVIPMELFKQIPLHKSTVYGEAAFQKFYLDLPEETISKLLFDHVMLVYNPNGHAPGAFQFPQMNFSFYMRSRNSAESYIHQPIQEMNSALLPAGFQPIQSIGSWGQLWIRNNSPVLQDCFILHDVLAGTMDRHLAFYSPMASIELIKNNPAVSAPIPLPLKVEQSGYYPTTYSIRQEGNNLVVSLENLVFQKME